MKNSYIIKAIEILIYLLAILICLSILVNISNIDYYLNSITNRSSSSSSSETFKSISKIVRFNKPLLDVKVEVADTISQRETGLMGRTSMERDAGMLFIFDNSAIETFWMKNTNISLDIIFFDDNFNVINIAKNTKINQTTEVYPSIYPAKYVLEVNAGFSDENEIKVGDSATYTLN